MQMEKDPSVFVVEPQGIIRPMGQDDVLRVMEIESVTNEFPWTESIFRDCLRVNYSCWVIEAGPGDTHSGVAAGVSPLWGYGLLSTSGLEAHILQIVIRRAQQKKGLGAQMMRHLIGVAKEMQAEVVCLEVRVSNIAAICLYQQLGFQQTGQRKDYYPAPWGQREDALLFTLDLIPPLVDQLKE